LDASTIVSVFYWLWPSVAKSVFVLHHASAFLQL
jgi:hypothetical protein